MLRFGANLVGFGLVNFLARNLDNVLIGCFSGAAALGYYDRAYKLLLLPLYNVNAPLSRVTVPLLSRIESDKPRLRNAFLKITSQVGLVTIPGMAALVATSGETVEILFGPGWQPVAPIFAWLGLAGLVQPITWAVTWLLVAQGRTATMFRWGAYASSTAILSFAVGLRWGPSVWHALTRSASTCSGFPCSISPSSELGPSPPSTSSDCKGPCSRPPALRF